MRLFVSPIIFCFTFLSLPALAVSVDVLCLTNLSGKSRGIEFRSYYDPGVKWSGAVARYEGSTRVIPLISKYRQVDVVAPDRPYQETNIWWEVLDGRFTGEYEMVSQGSMVAHFSYTNYKSKTSFDYIRDPNVDFTETNGCAWQDRSKNG
ncbi:hypothetical protein [Cupriavidus agavae]|nr:hypothetical protein [Cupriavidus agavae]